MPTLNGLIREAGQAARWRGHKLGSWARVPGNANAECKVCGAYVGVILKPMPNEIDIGGDAVALSCPVEA